MPLQKCQNNNESGWRWGNSGHCYTGPGGKKKAIKQGIAIEGPKKFSQVATEEEFSIAMQELSTSEATLLSLAKAASAKINDLPDSDFAYIAPGGKKDSSGKTVPRSLRHLPIHDAAHVRNALARLSQTDIPAAAKKEALAKIKRAAKKFGVEVSGDNNG